MAFKFIVFAAMVACARAGAIGYAAGPVYEDQLAYAAQGAYAPQGAYASQGAYHGGQVALAHAPAAYHAAAPLAVAAPLAIHTKVSDESYDPHPQYNYSYDVHDTITGDAKSQHEERDGDVVRGRYSLIEPDGTKRVVEYAVDGPSGFNAVVHREPATHAVAAVAHHAPIAVAAHAAPIAIAHQAPLAAAAYHSAPAAYAAHPAPYALQAQGHHDYY